MFNYTGLSFSARARLMQRPLSVEVISEVKKRALRHFLTRNLTQDDGGTEINDTLLTMRKADLVTKVMNLMRNHEVALSTTPLLVTEVSTWSVTSEPDFSGLANTSSSNMTEVAPGTSYDVSSRSRSHVRSIRVEPYQTSRPRTRPASRSLSADQATRSHLQTPLDTEVSLQVNTPIDYELNHDETPRLDSLSPQDPVVEERSQDNLTELYTEGDNPVNPTVEDNPTGSPQPLHPMVRCVVCYLQPRSTLFLPCSHLACCYECGEAMKTCPVCRDDIWEAETVYIP